MKVCIRAKPRTLGPEALAVFTAASAHRDSPFPRIKAASASSRKRSEPRPIATARVIVNRVWAGISGGARENASDFGLRGERPTNPELARCARRVVMENGWSFRNCTGLSSRAARAGVAAHAAAGFERSGLAARSRRTLDTKGGGKARDLVKSSSNRRTVYAFVDRKTLPNLFRSFELPRSELQPRRNARHRAHPRGTLPSNSPFVVERAKDLANSRKPDSRRPPNRRPPRLVSAGPSSVNRVNCELQRARPFFPPIPSTIS